MPRTSLALVLALTAATAALAHSGVEDPLVLERMELMKTIKDDTAVLGGMVKGDVAFDAARAAEIRDKLSAHAEAIPAHFETKAMDPKSEAVPVIWEQWVDFEAESEIMRSAAADLDTSSLDGLRVSFGPLAKSCRSCHESYRIEK